MFHNGKVHLVSAIIYRYYAKVFLTESYFDKVPHGLIWFTLAFAPARCLFYLLV